VSRPTLRECRRGRRRLALARIRPPPAERPSEDRAHGRRALASWPTVLRGLVLGS
jgi:hypothetical protein